VLYQLSYTGRPQRFSRCGPLVQAGKTSSKHLSIAPFGPASGTFLPSVTATLAPS